MTPLYRIGWLFSYALFRFYFRGRSSGAERLPGSGPAVLVSNHASYFDPFFVGSSVSRQLCYMARETLFRFPILGWILRRWQAIPIDRDGGGVSGMREILDRLAGGNAVMLFPEGTRTRDGRLGPARAGVGLIVVKTQAPVIPVRVIGSFEAYGRQMKFPRPKRVTVVFGAPIDLAPLRQEAGHCSKARLKDLYREIAERVMRAIAELDDVEIRSSKFETNSNNPTRT